MNKIITSSSNPKIKELVEILHTQKKENTELYLVEGEHLVGLAKDKGVLLEVFSLLPYDFKNNTIITDNVLNKITTTKTPQGVVGLCRKKVSKLDYSQPIVFLEEVQDPSNVGAILRTLCSFNYKQVILGNTGASLYNPKTLLASQGSYLSLDIIIMESQEVIKLIKDKEYLLLSTEIDKTASKLEDIASLKRKTMIVFGNEGKGVSSLIKANKDKSIYIDTHDFDSLNVSVCAGIILYNLRGKFTD